MNLKLTTLAACALIASGYAFAHHSFAAYDIRNAIDITGVTEQFVYRRPHPKLTVLDEDGEPLEDVLERYPDPEEQE